MTQLQPDDRILPTEGILNLRDYGGYRTAGGGTLRSRTLFRSAGHANATDNDLAMVDALDLRAIIDLRNDSEREAQPCRRGPAFQGRVYFVGDETVAAAPHLAAVDTPSTPDMVHDRMLRYYAQSPFREAQIAALSMYFHAVADADGASLVHCAAGKDRTGIAVALLQASLGVAMDDIVADYLLTNDAGSIEERAEAFAYSVKRHLGHTITPETLKATLSVEPDYIAATFDALTERCGSLDGYMSDVLGIDGATRNLIAQHLIV